MLQALNADAAHKLAPYDAVLGELELLRDKLPPCADAPPADPPAAPGAGGMRAVLDGTVPLPRPGA